MKLHIETLIQSALRALEQEGELKAVPAFIQVDATKNKQHGDYASNIALLLAKLENKPPRALAEQIVSKLPASARIKKIEVKGPGFINFFLSPEAFHQVVSAILTERNQYGRSKIGREKQILVEFLSSNPTGPLHVGHGRNAALGDIVANLLEAIGFKVHREYYVNDAGRQMDILTVSIWLRYLALLGQDIMLPANAYRGEYIIDIAKAIYAKHHDEFVIDSSDLLVDLPKDEPDGGDKEIYIDALIKRAKKCLGNRYVSVFDLGLAAILGDIRNDLSEFGVNYDQWFSEREFIKSDRVDHIITQLKEHGDVYEREGALWFRSTNYGDEKDRVIVRSNGERTYFAHDIAYHINKFERGFDLVVDIFGSDHHGYVPRIKAAIEALGIHPERLIYLLVQFVTLYRGHEQVQMSTRGGNFVTLRELREEVGSDAARFFYVMRKAEQHIDFDLDLAKSQSHDNPVYYIQYAYARICSVFRQCAEREIIYDEAQGLSHLQLLVEPHEQQILNTLSQYPDMIRRAALNYEPCLLTTYLRELAADFHGYYNAHQFLTDDHALRNARLTLLSSVKQTLANGFSLLRIEAKEEM
ncbi:MAG: arginine--tRNA ligase [Gammaproteobacteria bacterium RIFCSPHIGHO2_12_FULL_38_14]|nr:MAG: arginine--tRNA ligase [Gammaproteobacteria bacterium RIFCSPHIGHO2_12_FULL_38_14]